MHCLQIAIAYPGTHHTKRVINTIEGDEGVLGVFNFLKGWVNELPCKAYNSTKSAADKAELEETRLDVQQALLESLSHGINWGEGVVDMAAQP